MGAYLVALFGEAEKGEYYTGHYCRSLTQLVDCLGNPPPDSQGLYYATQALLYERDLIFFRVKEEGFSSQDYFIGLNILEKENLTSKVAAFCTPGVGDKEIIERIEPLCHDYHSILITSEADLYDFLTNADFHDENP